MDYWQPFPGNLTIKFHARFNPKINGKTELKID